MGAVPGLLINATCVHREPRGPPTRGVRWDDGLGPHQRGQAPHVVQPKRPPRKSQASAQSRQEAVHVVARDTIESDTARLVLAHGGKGERVDTDRTTYEKAVRDHLARRRQAMPIVPRDALSPLAEWQNRILGADLIQWNNNIADSLLSERAVLGKLQNWHKNPIIFFISTMPGLVASQEIIGDEHGRFVWGLPEDFDSFEERDEEHIFHVEYRSLFKEPESDADVKELTKSHPLAPGESHFIHTVESVMGPLFARGGEHVWKWDGEKLELLEEAWRTWVS